MHFYQFSYEVFFENFWKFSAPGTTRGRPPKVFPPLPTVGINFSPIPWNILEMYPNYLAERVLYWGWIGQGRRIGKFIWRFYENSSLFDNFENKNHYWLLKKDFLYSLVRSFFWDGAGHVFNLLHNFHFIEFVSVCCHNGSPIHCLVKGNELLDAMTDWASKH